MPFNMGATELLIIAGIIILLFGATKLPHVARSLGQSARVFKAEARGMKEDEEAAKRDREQGSEPQRLTAGGTGSQAVPPALEDIQRSSTEN